MSNQNLKLSFVLPVRNEGLNIKIMLKMLYAVVEMPYEVLIVYDTPDDDAVSTVKSIQSKYTHIHLVYNEQGPGVANAIKIGVAQSQGEYVLIFAADEVGPVLGIEEMIQLMDEGCDLVSFTRYAHGGRRLGGPLYRRVFTKLSNNLFRLITGSVFTDVTTGVKIFRKSLFDDLKLESASMGWAIMLELSVKAQARNLKFGEVPIISIDRLYGGKSNFSIKSWMSDYVKWYFWGVKHIRKVTNKSKISVKTPIKL